MANSLPNVTTIEALLPTLKIWQQKLNGVIGQPRVPRCHHRKAVRHRVLSVPAVQYGRSILNKLPKEIMMVSGPRGSQKRLSESSDLICSSLSLSITAVAAELL